MEKQHNYGVGEVYMVATAAGTDIWKEATHKNVTLVNVADCKDRITVSHVRHRLMGSGWFEWEDLLANWLVEIIVEAIENHKEEADISKLFSGDLHGDDKYGSFSKDRKQVEDFLMGRLFECLEENEDGMKVRIIEKSICKP